MNKFISQPDHRFSRAKIPLLITNKCKNFKSFFVLRFRREIMHITVKKKNSPLSDSVFRRLWNAVP